MQRTLSTDGLPKGRKRLSHLIQGTGDVISVDDAVRLLDQDRSGAAKALARWTDQGWLRRVGKGRYVAVSLDSLDSELVVDDPWILVPALFDPAYVGGRSAAEYWDLTEQIFNDVVVLTGRPLRKKEQRRQGTSFTLKHISAEKIFGTKTAWRGKSRVAVSDLHRTMVDMLDDPTIGGGIQQVADCLNEYLKRADRDDDRLVDYTEKLGNGAVFKRLGFLVESDPRATGIVEACRARLTAGNAKLDPALDCPKLASRWHLWIPATWTTRAS